MKNHKYIIGIIFLLLMWISKGYSQIDSCTLTVEINQIQSNNGLIALQLYDNNQKLITSVIERILQEKRQRNFSATVTCKQSKDETDR